MHEYEIRILQAKSGPTAIITSELQFTDGAAIRSARKLAQGRPFEVRKGLDCVVQSEKPVAV